ncbi:hypothetical protein DPSP01_009552 [Paraphaeosphaeria sporulosa]
MKAPIQLTLLALAGTSLSKPVSSPEPICRDIKLTVTASADNIDLPPFPNDTSPTAFGRYAQSFNVSNLDTKRVGGTFNIAATYCEPSRKIKGREHIIQFLLHGLGYTKEYWNGLNFPNVTYPGQYSWTHHANSQGYATLAIDNLGDGESDHPDPISMVQLPLQEAIILEIFKSLRNKAISCIPTKYSKIIMVTHSYGALIGRAVATDHPHPATGADAYIQTASSSELKGINAAVLNWAPRAASVVDPARFSHLPPAYLQVAPRAIRETVYGYPGEYDAEVLAWDESLPKPFSIGQILPPKPNTASSFRGPVIYITGTHDAIVCDRAGNTTLLTTECAAGRDANPGLTAEKFPKARKFVARVVKATGHNVNLHYSAHESFVAAHQLLTKMGF